MFRHRHPFGIGSTRTIGLPRVVSMIFLLALLGMLAYRARDPAMWRWLTGEPNPGAAGEMPPEPAGPSQPLVETLDPGPRDDDPEQRESVRRLFSVVTDKAPISREEMPAYWRLWKWSRSQSFDDLDRRARRDILYTQLWDQPDKYRGQLIRLRLHVVRVLQYEMETSDEGGDDGPRHVYELWGWTDDSKSFPYVVVCSQLPPDFSIGGDVREEAVFTGYFFKLMSYEAFDKARASPLLIGRVQAVQSPLESPDVTRARNRDEFWWIMAAGGLVLGVLVWRGFRRKQPTKSSADAPPQLVPFDERLQSFDSESIGATSFAIPLNGHVRIKPESFDEHELN